MVQMLFQAADCGFPPSEWPRERDTIPSSNNERAPHYAQFGHLTEANQDALFLTPDVTTERNNKSTHFDFSYMYLV
jgi:hypothetical protein